MPDNPNHRVTGGATPPLHHETRARWFGLAGVAVASFIGCIDFTIVNTAIPAIQDSLGASVSETQWIVTLFVTALSAFMVVMGRLADRYGRRKVLFAGIVTFAIASAGAGARARSKR
jgi:MFS family permease